MHVHNRYEVVARWVLLQCRPSLVWLSKIKTVHMDVFIPHQCKTIRPCLIVFEQNNLISMYLVSVGLLCAGIVTAALPHVGSVSLVALCFYVMGFTEGLINIGKYET